MKLNKSLILRAAAVAAVPIILAVLFFTVIAEPQNGRKYTVHLVDTIVLQADPPANKLLKYMEKKYGKKFIRVDKNSYSILFHGHHELQSGAWEYLHNGITVTTDDSSGEFYHVCDNYGEYLDNYSCYLINDEVQAKMNKEISAVIDNAKAACYPRDIQHESLPAQMTVSEYLDKANYWAFVAICGNGENGLRDYEKICKAFKRKSGQGWLIMQYYDKADFDSIDMSDFHAALDCENYNVMLHFDIYTSEPYFSAPDE